MVEKACWETWTVTGEAWGRALQEGPWLVTGHRVGRTAGKMLMTWMESRMQCVEATGLCRPPHIPVVGKASTWPRSLDKVLQSLAPELGV